MKRNKIFIVWMIFVALALIEGSPVNKDGDADVTDFKELRINDPRINDPQSADEDVCSRMDLINMDGEYDASSNYASDHAAANAFKPQTSNAPWANEGGAFPAKVWIKFRSNVHLNRISFTSRHGSKWNTFLEQAPETFNVIASNDGENWSTLLHVESASFTDASQTNTWDVACNENFFKFVGIEVLQAAGGKRGFTAITNITMWGQAHRDINECEGQYCSENGQCEDGINDYKCICNVGFTGKDCETGATEQQKPKWCGDVAKWCDKKSPELKNAKKMAYETYKELNNARYANIRKQDMWNPEFRRMRKSKVDNLESRYLDASETSRKLSNFCCNTPSAFYDECPEEMKSFYSSYPGLCPKYTATVYVRDHICRERQKFEEPTEQQEPKWCGDVVGWCEAKLTQARENCTKANKEEKNASNVYSKNSQEYIAAYDNFWDAAEKWQKSWNVCCGQSALYDECPKETASFTERHSKLCQCDRKQQKENNWGGFLAAVELH